MLKTIDPLLNPDVLHALAAMGHGDMLVMADRNFPAAAVARHTLVGRPLHMGGVPVERAVAAILSLMPLDSFVPDAAIRMEVVGDPAAIPAPQIAVQAAIDAAEGRHWPLTGLERHAFYARARQAFCVVHTDEDRPYGCFILTKGVIFPVA
ncbi:MAG: RbsD/FucU family protein [Gemmobacter sp.]